MHADEPGRAGRGAQGVPAGRRGRRRRDLPRLGDPRLPRRDPQRGPDRERRDRHDRRRRGRRSPTPTGAPVERGAEEVDLGRGGGREGRLRDLHDEGDPRAARRGRRDDRRPAAAPTTASTSPRSSLDDAFLREPEADRDRRLRHLLPRRPGRPLRDRGVGAGAGRDGHRLRVPLPQPGGRPRRPGDRDHPVGRDRRHAGGDAAGPRARRQGAGGDQHHGQPGDPRRRRRPLHPGRAGDRRRRDQDLRRPGRGDVPDRAAAGRAARDAGAASGSPSWSPS